MSQQVTVLHGHAPALTFLDDEWTVTGSQCKMGQTLSSLKLLWAEYFIAARE